MKLTAICRGGASDEYGRCFSPTVQLLFSTPLQAGTLFKCGGAIIIHVQGKQSYGTSVLVVHVSEFSCALVSKILIIAPP